MSAIFGIVNFDGRPAHEDVARMDAALAMYGNRTAALWCCGSTALGSRITRYTPEDAREYQPLEDTRNGTTLVADVRIDNRSEIAGELGIADAEAREMPDSAFILRAYERWGVECCTHLIGAFAFALYDERIRQLLLVRSARGERSLVYHAGESVFAFATAPRGIFALKSIERRVNLPHFADFLADLSQDPEETFYSGVKSLPLGCSLVLRGNIVAIRRYWHPDPGRSIRFRRDEDYVEAFNELFERVVRDNLRADRPAGMMLSGGLDSTAVAAVSARTLGAQGKSLLAYTYVPPANIQSPIPKGWYVDETPFVEALVRRYNNISVEFVRSRGKLFLEDVLPIFEAAEAPFRSAPNNLWAEEIGGRFARRGGQVLLTGGAGNLTMSWTGQTLLARLISQGHWMRALVESRALARTQESDFSLKPLGQAILTLLPYPLWALTRQLRKSGADDLPAHEAWRRKSAIRSSFAAEQRVSERAMERGNAIRARLLLGTRSEILTRTDNGGHMFRAYQQNTGIQDRAPANDQRIVNYCLAIPEDQHLRNGVTRWLIRRGMADRVPPEILQNNKRGLQPADALDRIVAAGKEVLHEIEEQRQSPLAREAIDLDRVHQMVNTLPERIGGLGEERMNFVLTIYGGLMAGRFLRWVESGQ